MSTPITYSLVLKSYSSTGSIDSSADNANIYYTSQIASFFQKIAAVHQVTAAKLELTGCIASSEHWGTFQIIGIDIIVKIPYTMSTTYNTTNNGYSILGGLVTKPTNNENANYELAYSSPLFLTNLAGISDLNIQLFDSLTGTLITNSYCPSYSLMLTVTPLYN